MGEEPEHEYTFMLPFFPEGHGNSINFAQCN